MQPVAKTFAVQSIQRSDLFTKRDRYTLEKMKERNNGSFFIPDVNKKLNITKIRLLELCNLDQFLQPGSEWSNKSP
ncbi:MAG: hypothetical protein QNJ70_07700 [Xenococcaceae cyanobacterium MO_207.B15]|nr:hypothetical protein [Xenococcaceae cyanobacterium MO_207.B15]